MLKITRKAISGILRQGGKKKDVFPSASHPDTAERTSFCIEKRVCRK